MDTKKRTEIEILQQIGSTTWGWNSLTIWRSQSRSDLEDGAPRPTLIEFLPILKTPVALLIRTPSHSIAHPVFRVQTFWPVTQQLWQNDESCARPTGNGEPRKIYCRLVSQLAKSRKPSNNKKKLDLSLWISLLLKIQNVEKACRRSYCRW